MKTLYIFAGPKHYPSGGWCDLRAKVTDLETALKFALLLQDDNDWWHIVDADTLTIVAQWETEVYT